MNGPDLNRLATGAVQLLIVLFSLSVHEFAHAWLADRLGDPTAKALGRVSLNPLRHLDPFGSLFMPVVMIALGTPVFAWARPSPLVVANLRHPRRDGVLIAAAGPAANLLLAGAATVGLGIAVHVLGPEARAAATVALQQSLFRDAGGTAGLHHFPLLYTLVQMATLNALLALFHLIPVPRLDGATLLLSILPPDWAARYAGLRPLGYAVIMGLGFLGVLVSLVPGLLVLTLVVYL